MNIRQYIIFFGIGTLIMISSWILVLLSIDPVTAGNITLIIFYSTLVLSLLGFFTTFLTILRTRKHKKQNAEEAVLTSLRQGVILGALFIVSLLLLHNNLFTYFSIFLLLFFFGLVEFLFLNSSQKSKK